jgi:hypothetical protein
MLPDLGDGDARAYGRGALSALLISGLVVVIAPFVGSIAFVLFTAFAALIGMCAELGPGVWQVDGVTYRCG